MDEKIQALLKILNDTAAANRRVGTCLRAGAFEEAAEIVKEIFEEQKEVGRILPPPVPPNREMMEGYFVPGGIETEESKKRGRQWERDTKKYKKENRRG